MVAVEVVFDIYSHVPCKNNVTRFEQLHNIISPFIFLSFMLLIVFRYMGDELIICFNNSYEMSKWMGYIDTLCYTSPKYFVCPFDIGFPYFNTSSQSRNATYINYYQWVQIVFLMQSIIFCLPYWWWEEMKYKTGLFVKTLITVDSNNEPNTNAKSFMRILKVNHMRSDFIFGIIKPSNYLTNVHLFYKFFNFINPVIQILFLRDFLNFESWFWGVSLSFEMVNGNDWEITGHFPTTVFCDFPRRDEITGNQLYSTSMCLLPYNDIFKLFFAFEWYWMFLLVLIGLIDFINFFIFFHVRYFRILFIEKYLEPYGIDRSDAYFYKFVDMVLERDGMTWLKILSINAPFSNTSQFCFDMWESAQIYFPLKKALFV